MTVCTFSLLALLPWLVLVSSAPSRPAPGHQYQQPVRYHPAPRYLRGPPTIKRTTFNIPPRRHYPRLPRPVPHASLAYNDLHAPGGESAVQAAILSPGFRAPSNIHLHREQYGRVQNLAGGLHGGGDVEEVATASTSSEVGHKGRASAGFLSEGQRQVHGKQHQTTYYRSVYQPAGHDQSYHQGYRHRQQQHPRHHQPHQTAHAQQIRADQRTKSTSAAEAQKTRRLEARADQGHRDVNVSREDEDSAIAGQKDGNADNDEILPLRQDDVLQPLQAAGTLDHEHVSSNSVPAQMDITVKQRLEGQRPVSSEDKEESDPQAVLLQSKAVESEQKELLEENPSSHITDYERLFPNVEWGNKIKPGPLPSAADDTGDNETRSEHDETTTTARSEGETSGDDNEGMTSHNPGVGEEQKPPEQSVDLSIVINLESESSGATHDEDQQKVKISSVSTSNTEAKVSNTSSAYVPTTQEPNASSIPSNAEDAAEEAEYLSKKASGEGAEGLSKKASGEEAEDLSKKASGEGAEGLSKKASGEEAEGLSKKASDENQRQGHEKEVSREVQKPVNDTDTTEGKDEKLTMNEVIHSANSEAAPEINATGVSSANQNLTKEMRVHTEENEAAQKADTKATGDQNLRQEESVAEMPEAAEETDTTARKSSSDQLSAGNASEEATSSTIRENQDDHGQGKDKEASEKVHQAVSDTSIKDGKEGENQTTKDKVLSDTPASSTETKEEENGASSHDLGLAKEGEGLTTTNSAGQGTIGEIDAGMDVRQEETYSEPTETANKSNGEANDKNTSDETQDTADTSREQTKLIEEETASTPSPGPVAYFTSILRPSGLYRHPYPVTHGFSHHLYGYSLPVTTYGIRKTFYREKNDGYRSVETHKLHHNYQQAQQASLSGKQQQENVQEPVLTVVRGGGQLVPVYMPQSYSPTLMTKAGENAEVVPSKESQE